MNKKINANDEFINRLHLLEKHIMYANIHLDIMSQIDLSFDHVKTVFKSAPIFYHFTKKAHYETAFTHVMRLVDSHDDSFTIYKFLNFVQSNPSIFKLTNKNIINRQVSFDRKSLLKMDAVIQKIKDARDTYYAHLDKKNLNEPYEIFIKYPIACHELSSVLTKMKKILNNYSMYFNQGFFTFKMIGQDDITSLLKHFHKLKSRRP